MVPSAELDLSFIMLQDGQPTSPESRGEQLPFKWGRTKTTMRKRFMSHPRLQPSAHKEDRAFSDDRSISRSSGSAKEGAAVVPIQAVAGNLALSSGAHSKDGPATPPTSPTAVATNAVAGTDCNGGAASPRASEGSGATAGRGANGSAAVPTPDDHNGPATQSTEGHTAAPAKASQAACADPSPSKAVPTKQKAATSSAAAPSFLGKRSAPEEDMAPGKSWTLCRVLSSKI